MCSAGFSDDVSPPKGDAGFQTPGNSSLGLLSEAYLQGAALYADGRPEAALEQLEAAARQGSPDAAYLAGCVASELGRGPEAELWWRTAASLGDIPAVHHLAELELGRGDTASAHALLERAAHAQYAPSVAALARLESEAGEEERRKHWAKVGAGMGEPHCLAMHAMDIYLEGSQSLKAIQEALPFARRSAEAGNAFGMLWAGLLSGHLGNRDVAREWLVRAKAAGAGGPLAEVELKRLGF